MVSSMPAAAALSQLSDQERQWVEQFLARLRDSFGDRVRDVRIFGSKVRGDAGPESDVDLLVLVERCDFATKMDIVELARGTNTWLDAHVFDFDDYHTPVSRATGFYQEIRKESVRL